MLPVGNLNLKGLYDMTVGFFATRNPNFPSYAGVANDSVHESRPRISMPRDHAARLNRESTSLRERRDTFDTRNAANTPVTGLTLPPMRRELDDTKKELSRTKLEVSKLEGRCVMLEKMLRETKETLRARDAEVKRLRTAGMAARTAILLQRHDSSSSERTTDSIDIGQSIDDSDTDEEGSLAAEEERAQRRAAEVFMAKTDVCSGAQVLQAVHDLNSEILQFAATATEVCTFRHRSSAPSSRVIQAAEDTSARLGRSATHILSSRDHSQDPMLVQLILQGAVVTCISRAMRAFCIGFPSKHDNILSQIYAHMYMAVPQPTSSRWRALTLSHIHLMYPYLADYAVNELCESIYRYTADILLLSGSTGNPSDRTSLSSRDGIRARFGDQVRLLSKSACKLASLTRQEIFSTNFDLISFSHNDPFEASRMEDAFGAYGSSRGAVLATTEFGLRWTTRLDTRRSSPERNDVGVRVLLQPKVVLDESVLDFVES